MDKISISTSNALKLYRKEKGWTQADLAEKLDENNPKSVKTIAQWEQGKANVPIEVLIKIRNELGLSLDEIYGLEPIERIMPKSKLINKWIEEYSTDESIAFHREPEYPDFEDIKHLQEADIIVFLNGFSLPLVVDEEKGKIYLKELDTIESEIIDFFLRKKLINYFTTYDDETELVKKENFYVTPFLAKVLIENHIEFLDNSIYTEERILNLVTEKFSIEMAREFAKNQNKKTTEQLRNVKKMLDIVKGMSK